MTENTDLNSSSIEPIELSKKQLTSFIIVSISLWIIAFFLWFQTGIDKSVLFYLNTFHVNSNLVMMNRFLTSYGMSIIATVYAGYLAASLKITDMEKGRQAFFFFIIAFALSSIAGDVLKEIFDRARPFVQYGNQIHSFSNSSSPSFPSGHATKSISLVLPFIFFSPYKGGIHTLVKSLLGLMALGICFSRMFLAAHFLSDIVAAGGLVFICLSVSVYISNKMFRYMTQDKLQSAVKRWIFVYIALAVLLHII